jgi:hypothetical protein
MEQLPDVLLIEIVAVLGLRDALAVACTCSRLQQLALDTFIDAPHAGDTVRELAAAAKARVRQVGGGGAWRDALFLAAWKQQHGNAGSSSSSNTARSSEQLRGVLEAIDSAAALQLAVGDGPGGVAQQLAGLSTADHGGGAGHSVAFSSFWLPGEGGGGQCSTHH